jgi:hypothetical protein
MFAYYTFKGLDGLYRVSVFVDGNLYVHFQVASDVSVCDVLSSPWPMTTECLASRDKDGHHARVYSRRSQNTRVHEHPDVCPPAAPFWSPMDCYVKASLGFGQIFQNLGRIEGDDVRSFTSSGHTLRARGSNPQLPKYQVR